MLTADRLRLTRPGVEPERLIENPTPYRYVTKPPEHKNTAVFLLTVTDDVEHGGTGISLQRAESVGEDSVDRSRLSDDVTQLIAVKPPAGADGHHVNTCLPGQVRLLLSLPLIA